MTGPSRAAVEGSYCVCRGALVFAQLTGMIAFTFVVHLSAMHFERVVWATRNVRKIRGSYRCATDGSLAAVQRRDAPSSP